MKIGRAGNGTKIHNVDVYETFEGKIFYNIYCGAQQFNGTGNGQLRNIREGNWGDVTCKACQKRIAKGR